MAGVAAGVFWFAAKVFFAFCFFISGCAGRLPPLPLRPAHGFWLEVSAAFGDCESGGDRDCRGLVKRSTQYLVPSKKAGALVSIGYWQLGTYYEFPSHFIFGVRRGLHGRGR